MELKHLVSQIRKKRGASKPCKQCSKDIPVGEHYVSASYNDGFRAFFIGTFHQNCWEVHLEQVKNEIISKKVK